VRLDTAEQIAALSALAALKIEITEQPAVPGFEILAELGRGGMGVVYKARQVGLDRLVALKLHLDGLHADPVQRARFRAEAEAVARLHHPNIVQIYEVGEQAGRLYLALEYVAGPTLADVIGHKPQSPIWAAQLIATAAQAVHHAHQRGIVHRDLKPANILLQIADCGLGNEMQSAIRNPQSAIPKITDFGLAKRLDRRSEHSLSKVIIGTPSYIGPEQAECDTKRIGPATDVYSLGAILYEMVTGRPPFLADSTIGTLLQVVQDVPAAPSTLNSELPRDIETICLKCLAKEPAHRYVSAEALADDLLRFLRGKPIHARPAPWLERLNRSAKRRPARVAALAAGTFGIACLAVSWWWHASEARPDGATASSRQQRAAAGEWTEQWELIQTCLRLADHDQQRADFAEAERSYRRALRLLENALPSRQEPMATRRAAAETWHNLGIVLQRMQRLLDAEKALRQAGRCFDRLAQESPQECPYRFAAALCRNNLAAVLQLQSRPADAVSTYQEASAVLEALVLEFPAEVRYRQALAVNQDNISTVLQAVQRRSRTADTVVAVADDPAPEVCERIERASTRSIELWKKLVSEEPTSTPYLRGLAVAENHYGAYWQDRRRVAEAGAWHGKALERLVPICAAGTAPPDCRHELARTYYDLGVLAQSSGDRDAAAADYGRASALLEHLRAEYPNVADYWHDLQDVQTALKSMKQ
jgi:serine/threonine protein kinase